jgi:hypothetical protein
MYIRVCTCVNFNYTDQQIPSIDYYWKQMYRKYGIFKIEENIKMEKLFVRVCWYVVRCLFSVEFFTFVVLFFIFLFFIFIFFLFVVLFFFYFFFFILC